MCKSPEVAVAVATVIDRILNWEAVEAVPLIM
jgi:hypothetical protein